MDNPNPSQLARDLMDKVGLKRSYAYQLARGLKSPALPLAVRIEDAMGVPARFWIDRTNSCFVDISCDLPLADVPVEPAQPPALSLLGDRP